MALTSTAAQRVLDWSYHRAVKGAGKGEPVPQLAATYLARAGGDPEAAIQEFLRYARRRVGTVSFLTGLGGLATLPVAIPAEVANTLYMQLRMVTVIAALRGYDLNDDRVKTMTLITLTGNAAEDYLKKAGIAWTGRLGERVSAATLQRINQLVGRKLFAVAGEHGRVHFSKLVPLLGAGVGAGVDIAATATLAVVAKQTFSAGHLAHTTRTGPVDFSHFDAQTWLQ
ncbi:MAG: EcsC family protein [Schleiferilactobacillus harbinensis]